MSGNSTEIALGAQYDLTDKLAVSVGWLHVFSGATSKYQSDMDFDLNSNTFGGGIGYKINPMFELNLAGSYSIYTEGEKTYDAMLGTTAIPTTEKYNKSPMVLEGGTYLNATVLPKKR